MNGDIKATSKGLIIKIGWKAIGLWVITHWQWIFTCSLLMVHIFMTHLGQMKQDKQIHDLQAVVACMADENCRNKK